MAFLCNNVTSNNIDHDQILKETTGRGRQPVLIKLTQGEIGKASSIESCTVRLNALSLPHLCTRTSDCDAISSRNSLVRRRYKGPVH